jgi:hypothetical protein
MNRLLPLRLLPARLWRILPLGALLFATMGVGPCGHQPLGSVDAATARDGGSGYDAASDLPKTCVDSQGNLVPCGVDAGPICFDNQGNRISCGWDAGTDIAMPRCQYNGTLYFLNETFSSADGCNTCSCTASGVACTDKACFDGGPSFDGGVVDIPPVPGACTLGSDQTCNEDPTGSTLRGKCQPDGSCACASGSLASPYTGRCLDPGDTSGKGCEYGGVLQPMGSTFACTDGCNVCFCEAPGKISMTEIACGQDGGVAMCGLDAVYLYGNIGGLVAAHDQVTLAPAATSPATSATYVYNRTTTGGASGLSCSPALPACPDPAQIDVSDIMADVADPIVQKYLSVQMSPPMLFGVDARLFDGQVFSFQRGDGHGFLVGPATGRLDASRSPVPWLASWPICTRSIDSSSARPAARRWCRPRSPAEIRWPARRPPNTASGPCSTAPTARTPVGLIRRAARPVAARPPTPRPRCSRCRRARAAAPCASTTPT